MRAAVAALTFASFILAATGCMVITSESLVAERAPDEVMPDLAWLHGPWELELDESERWRVAVGPHDTAALEVALTVPEGQSVTLTFTAEIVHTGERGTWLELGSVELDDPSASVELEEAVGDGKFMHVLAKPAGRGAEVRLFDAERFAAAVPEPGAPVGDHPLEGGISGDIFVVVTSPAERVRAYIAEQGDAAWSDPVVMERPAGWVSPVPDADRSKSGAGAD